MCDTETDEIALIRLQEGENFLKKFDAGEEFTEKDIRELLFDSPILMEIVEGEDHRWVRDCTAIFTIKGRTFLIEYTTPLTECQTGSEEYYPPYEVTVEEEQVTVTRKKYYSKKNGKLVLSNDTKD